MAMTTATIPVHQAGRPHNHLELLGITKTFKNDIFKKNHIAINGLTCSFPTGKCTGLLGHNGAGKTTTIRVILGLVFSDRGDIKFNGENLGRKHRKVIGYMPEINKLPANLTPYEILHQQLQVYSPLISAQVGKNAMIEKALKDIELWDHRHKKVKHLSKGMGRKLAWAHATIHNPILLILDEPFSGLDPVGRMRMRKWIEEQKIAGTTIILCTHELWAVEALCDEVHIIRKGSLVFSTLSADFKNDHPTQEGVYSLHLSGVNIDLLNSLQRQYGLPNWSKISQEGWLSKLQFQEYNSATKWLSLAMSRGFVVIYFGSEGIIKEQNLLPYFEGDT
jgi:ABC-2 type transport system ATP-binding protein